VGWVSQNAPNSLSAGDLPETPLRELASLPQTPWLYLRGLLLRGRTGRGGVEKGRGRKCKGEGSRGSGGKYLAQSKIMAWRSLCVRSQLSEVTAIPFTEIQTSPEHRLRRYSV